MHGLNPTRELVQDVIDKRYTIDEMTERFGVQIWPLPIGPAGVWFFTQENIHGNFANVTADAPARLQRSLVLDYCKRNNTAYEFEYFEWDAMTHLPTLHHAVEARKSNGVLYSSYSLPPIRSFRPNIVDAALANGVISHFVNENVTISNEAERHRDERMLALAKAAHSVCRTSDAARAL